MSRLLRFLMWAGLASSLSALGQTPCPNCFSTSSFTPLSGHGTGPNNGRIITVCFDSSAQVDNNGNSTPGTTNVALWNALNGTGGAINAWNDATSGGYSSGYYLQYNCSGTPDVLIQYASHSAVTDGCAVTGIMSGGSGQETMTFSDWLAQSLNSSDIVQALSHEFGHVFGLAHDSNCTTIMYGVTENGPGKQCNPLTPTSVTSNDVQSAQDVINRSGLCTATPSGSQGDENDGNSDPGGTLCTGQPPIQCSGGTAECDPYGWYCSNWNYCNEPEPEPCCEECYESCENSQWTCIGSPIVLDVFGTGFHLTDIHNGVRFRVLPSQTPRQMGWPDAAFRNGWLALDRNGDGKITDFTELFGNATAQPKTGRPNGYLALAVFDAPSNGGNGNGVIDPGDSIYSHLLVWIDDNHNGISEPEELHSLQEVGIFKIDLDYTYSRYVDGNGNEFRYKARVWDKAGTKHDMCYDVFVKIAF